MSTPAPKTNEELMLENESMKVKMLEVEAENARLKNAEKIRMQDSGQRSKSRSFVSKIRNAESFKSLAKHLDLDQNLDNFEDPDEKDDEDVIDQDAKSKRSSSSFAKFAVMMMQEMSKLQRSFAQIPGAPASLEEADPQSYADSPFCDNISEVEITKKMSVPQMNQYDGTTDPHEHVSEYKQKMSNVPVSREVKEAVMCKGFGSTLKGPALRWLINIPNGTIKSFAQLVNMFNSQFASSRLLEKHSSDLYKIVQDPFESLRSYLTRFNGEMISIPNCEHGIAIGAFREGLRMPSDLYTELTKYTCKSFEDVRTKALAEIRVEEDAQIEKQYESGKRTIPTSPTYHQSNRVAPYARPGHRRQ